jgi:hypothetical protein
MLGRCLSLHPHWLSHVPHLLLLKCVFVDTVYMNVMRINTQYEGPNYLVCDSIEEYLRFEQHRSCLVARVNEEDMSIENQYYGETVCLNKMITV